MEPELQTLTVLDDRPAGQADGAEGEGGGGELSLEERYAALQDEVEELRHRLTQPPVPAFDPNQLATATAQAVTQSLWNVQNQHQANQRPAAPPPPQLSDEDRENLLADPAALEAFVQRNVQYGMEYLYHHLQPQLQHLQALPGIARVTDQLTQRHSRLAEAEARNALEATGVMAGADFDALLPRVRELMQHGAQNDPVRLREMVIDPDAVALAAQTARMMQPQAPRSTPPASIGSGRGGAGTGRRTPAVAKPQALLDMERSLGVTFSAQEVEDYVNRQKTGFGR